MSTMRAVLIKDGKGKADALYIGEAPKPSAGPGQIVVKIKAFGLNRMDILQREGKYPVPKGASHILGVEFAGTISDIGPAPEGENDDVPILRQAIGRFKQNDEVYGLAYGGAYAEYIIVQATHLMPKPSHLSFVQAASIPEVWLTAYQALKLVTNIQPKVHVLIHAGASGVGLAAIQLARLFGAATVTATASTTSKLAFLTGSDSSSASLPPHGRATQGVNYKTEDFSKKVEEHTGGHGVDVVVDFVGASHWEKNIASLASDGRMVLLAFMGGAVVPNVNLYDFLRKRISVQGSSLRARSVAYQADLIARFVKDVSEKLTGEDGDGDVRTYIHKVYKWEQIKEAHQEMEGNDTIGKIIMEIS